ncbi:flavin reductase family protein [Streptomonospora nanhaiensis]|uniref:Flavin reductase (DIM6/NTAB) family NADH-FMN oxidoreductase RutF n=1 Tax=Streptomonospora nanhaiensis TaxID=1323731 RepID=A0A853BKB7_9ACTN|nr:flavin reductase family protein [Streptomonospora nanhaiensis]MBX9389422.1 flavin reductase family protein [Streptomonospora nanhaiensis]NYI95948.1 flavin reductase (DIM6/NTAB) family NADH-FMN oxidoreductase RutF [Streptomonospora nanhaiensis]
MRTVRATSSTATAGIDADRFRALLGHHPAGVVIVTATVSGTPVGLTATSFTSVSLAPPLVAFYVADTSATWVRMRNASVFGVHLLSRDQADLAARFATKGINRFAPPTSWRPGAENVPVLDDTAIHLVCRRHDTRLIGDHWLVVGEVAHGYELSDPRPPLLYHRGAYGGFLPGA